MSQKTFRMFFISMFLPIIVSCAHSISITPNQLEISEVNSFNFKVGYVISQEKLVREVITPGGGGDRVKYKPYQALDSTMKMALEKVFQNAVRIDSITNISSYPDVFLVFDPKIIKTDSSSSSFSWPPEQFTVEIECHIYDRDRKNIQKIDSIGQGSSTRADWGQFGNFTFGIAGSRAMQNAVEDLFAKMDNRLIAQSVESKLLFANSTTPNSISPINYNRMNTSEVGAGDNYAIVIGNNLYRNFISLKTAVNDADAVSECLNSIYGYEVQTLHNGTRHDILQALDKLRLKLTQKDNLLIYYAGHGFFDQKADRGYWLPVDANPDTTADWISNADITDKLRAIDSNHIMVVADSCYSGTLTRGVNVTMRNPDYFQKMAAMRSRTVLTSGGMEPVADSGGGEHSVFAQAFLNALEQNSNTIDGTELFTKIRRPVMLNANQTPQYGDIRMTGHEGGDFLFIRK